MSLQKFILILKKTANGASNEILGTIESGIDFEQRIAQIYDQCRTPEEIEANFAKLREDLQNQHLPKMACQACWQ